MDVQVAFVKGPDLLADRGTMEAPAGIDPGSDRWRKLDGGHHRIVPCDLHRAKSKRP